MFKGAYMLPQHVVCIAAELCFGIDAWVLLHIQQQQNESIHSPLISKPSPPKHTESPVLCKYCA